MKISEFFTVLGANLNNQRWSWGAVDPVINRVFLRVWEDDIDDLKHRVHVLTTGEQQRHGSIGYGERQEHLDLIKEVTRVLAWFVQL